VRTQSFCAFINSIRNNKVLLSVIVPKYFPILGIPKTISHRKGAKSAKNSMVFLAFFAPIGPTTEDRLGGEI
jgi:hypothetical protein